MISSYPGPQLKYLMDEYNSSQESFTIILIWIGNVKFIVLSNDGASRRGDTAYTIIIWN